MRIEQGLAGWWVVDVPDPQCECMGPYRTKADAESCMKRVGKFFKAEEDGKLEEHLNG